MCAGSESKMLLVSKVQTPVDIDVVAFRCINTDEGSERDVLLFFAFSNYVLTL